MSKTIEICYRARACNNAFVAWDVGMSKEEDHMSMQTSHIYGYGF